jgi:hypothetical protein
MNVRRGFFRLWLVFSFLFAMATFAISFKYIKGEFDQLSLKETISRLAPMEPVDCSLARGTEGADYIKNLDPYASSACWYEMPKFRKLFPEYADLTNDQLSEKLYPKVGLPLTKWDDPSPIRTILIVIGIAIGVPALVLALGITFGWAFAGFFEDKKP